MKSLQVYLFIFLGLGLILNINANAANTKKIDYLCISQNKDNKKEYVKHKDDEYLFQVFYKNKLLNLQKNKNCAYKVFATDPIFQPLFDTLSDKNIGKKILADGSWGLTKTIKKKIFLKEYENLKTTKKKPSQAQSNDNSYLVYYLCLNTSKDHHGYVKVQKYSKENNQKCENKVYAQQHRSLYFAIHEKRGRFTPSSAEKKGSRGIGWTRFMFAFELNELISKENKKGYKFVQFPIITNAQIAKKNLEKDKNNPEFQKMFISKRIINHEKNKRIVNVKSKKVSDVSYCYRPNTEILLLATSYNGSCKDQGALNAGFDG